MILILHPKHISMSATGKEILADSWTVTQICKDADHLNPRESGYAGYVSIIPLGVQQKVMCWEVVRDRAGPWTNNVLSLTLIFFLSPHLPLWRSPSARHLWAFWCLLSNYVLELLYRVEHFIETISLDSSERSRNSLVPWLPATPCYGKAAEPKIRCEQKWGRQFQQSMFPFYWEIWLSHFWHPASFFLFMI